jgi:glycine/D-amino acid oxidase-like deaminating enzyme/nitrite reductase/ring-hydroxylating ferredoxin subunit
MPQFSAAAHAGRAGAAQWNQEVLSMPALTDSGLSLSPWMVSADVPELPVLSRDAEADVCIVGAGIAGLTTAYLLTREGRSVVVIDDGPVAGGETGRTTAHLATIPDELFVALETLHGADGARLAHESHGTAVDLIEAIVTGEGIECDFERVEAYLFLAPGQDEADLAEELAAARRAGVFVEEVEAAPVPGLAVGKALRFPRQAQFHPLRYMTGLTRAIQAAGGRLFTGARAQQFEGGARPRVTTESGFTVTAGAVVVATNTPVNERVLPHLKQYAHRTYVVGFRVPPGTVPRALFWDTGEPYHYVRVASTGDPQAELLIAGGEDHRTGQADDVEQRYDRLEAWTRERFPSAGERVFAWSGQVEEPADGLAFIGPSMDGAENVYIATGDSGNGMTHGTIAGRLLTDLILGRANPWSGLYDPGRVRLRALAEYVKGGVQSTAPYTRWVTGGEVSTVDEIAAGEGAILRRGVRLLAVYRDPSGALVERSAVCPHLGCIVAWNGGEKSWDCPCHGSRFAADGHVLNGPAVSDLPPAED